MTRKENTGNRAHDLYFSRWVRSNLRDSYDNFRVYDIDFVLWDKKTREVRLLELKSFGKDVAPDQKLMLKMFADTFSRGIADGWVYKGVHLLQFEKSSFEDGKVYLNKEEITEQELIKFLNFEK